MESKAPKALLPSHTDRFQMIGDGHSHGVTCNNNYTTSDYFSRSNLCSIYSRFKNVIPEETEDALCGSPTNDNTELCYPLKAQSSVKCALDEIKKLGLTAQTSENKEKFEPFWVETLPKARGRSNSGGIIKPVVTSDVSNFRRRSSTDITAELPDTSVIFNPECHAIGTKSIGNRRHSDGNIDHTTKSVKTKQNERRGSCSGEMTQTPRLSFLNRADFDIGGTHKGVIIRKCSPNETSNDTGSKTDINIKGTNDVLPNFADIKRDIFKYNEVLKRSNSAGCLEKIKDKINIFNENGSDKVPAKLILDVDENENMKGTISTSVTRETNNTVDSSENRLDKSLSVDTESKIVESRDQFIKDSSFQNSERSFKFDSCDDKSNDKTKPLGEKSIQWIKNSKVRRTKREHNMFSPTSF